MNNIGWIYVITCIPTNKIYVGSTANILGPKARWKQHRGYLNRNKHTNRYLQNVWNKYGESNFTFEIIDEIIVDKAFLLEQHYIDTLRPELNLAPMAGTVRGVKHSPEVGIRHSARMKGRKLTPEQRLKISLALKGVPKPARSEDHVKNLRAAMAARKGVKLPPRSDEWKRNIGLSHSGEKCAFYGKKGAQSTVSTPVKDNNGTVYCSQREAAIALGLNYKSINKVLRGIRKQIRGYRFTYA